MSRPHGLKGARIQQRAERNADYFGLDEEMLLAMSGFLIASEHTPRPRKTAIEALMSPGAGLPPAQHWLATDRFAAEARRTKRHRLGCLERHAQPC